MRKYVITNGFVLNAKPYKETSLLVDILSKEYGRISVVANGARALKSHLKSMLQLFTPLSLTISNIENPLKTLVSCELVGESHNFLPPTIFSALYINELVSVLYKVEDDSTSLFDLYSETLNLLQENENIEYTLRIFEFNFLSILGYGINIDFDCVTGKRIREHTWYLYSYEEGFSEINNEIIKKNISINKVFNGSDLLALSTGNNLSKNSLRVAKEICKYNLNILLKNRELKSRELLIDYLRYK